MFRTSSDHPPKFLGSKDISTTTTTTAPSFRTYYGEISGSVPFLWESEPGTPKHLCDSVANSLPAPLTPPPSYYYQQNSDTNNNNNNNKKGIATRYRLLRNLLSKITFVSRSSATTTTTTVDYSSSLSSSSTSSTSSAGSYSSAPTTPSNFTKRRNWASFDHHDVSTNVIEDDGGIIISRTGRNQQTCFGFSKTGAKYKPPAVPEMVARGRGST